MKTSPMYVLEAVRATAVITDLYRECAAVESVGAYLKDWKEAKTLLDKQVKELEALYNTKALSRGDKPCDRCGNRPATSKYGSLATCGPCNEQLNDEFDEEYR
jgi:hypothetical protein